MPNSLEPLERSRDNNRIMAAGTKNGQRPPAKRSRDSEELVARIETQCAQFDTSLEVDHMILDYLAYQTIKACFASRDLNNDGLSPKSFSNNLALFDSCIRNFRARYPKFSPDQEIRLRLLLLKLITLFTQRCTFNPTTPCPRPERRITSASREGPLGQSLGLYNFDITAFDDDLPASTDTLRRNRAHVLDQLGVPAEDEHEEPFYGTSTCLSLLDLLPLFMQASALRNAMSASNLTDRWMDLACDFMLQACLEQYLVFGAKGVSPAKDSFDWGYDVNMDVDLEVTSSGEQANELNAMFEDEDYAVEVEGWASRKAECISQVLLAGDRVRPSTPTGDTENSTAATDLVSRLESIAEAHPIAEFEMSLLSFLNALSRSIADPVLVQLESGKLDGMTEVETKDFLASCGCSLAEFFHALHT